MSIRSYIGKVLGVKEKPKPTIQYTAPIGPTSKPDSKGVISTPTGKVSTSGGGSSGGGSLSNVPTSLGGTQPTGTKLDVSYTSGGSTYNPATKTLESNKLPSTTQTQINPQTGMPYGTITPAPTTSQQYSGAVKERGYFQGTKYYAGQKTSGFLFSNKYSPFYHSGSAESIGKLASTTVEFAPYAIPIVGGGLLVGSSAENILTPSGRGRISTTSTILKEKYNVPTYVSTPTQYGLNIGGIALGGSVVSKDVSKLGGYPKFTTQIIGTSESSISNNKLITDIAFKTNQKNLLGIGNKEFYGIAKGSGTYAKAETGELILGENIVFGKYAQYKPIGTPIVPIAKTKTMFPKNENMFNVISGTLSKPETPLTNIGIFNTKGSPYPLFTIEKYSGTSTLEAGKIGVGKASEFYTNPLKKNFVGYGVSFEKTKDVLNIGGKTLLVDAGKTLKKGQGTFSGYIFPLRNVEPSSVSLIQSGGAKSSQQYFQDLYKLQELQSLKTSISVSSAIASKETKVISNIPSSVSSMLKITTTPINKNYVSTQSIQSTSNKEITKLSTPQIYSTNQKNRFSSGSASSVIQALTTKEIFSQPVPSLTGQVIKSVNTFKVPALPPFSFTPIVPGGKGLIIPPFIPGGEFNFGLSTKIFKGKQRKKYTPSYSALLFNIKGKQPKTNIGFRPITKGFTWSFNNPKFKFKGKF